MIVLIRKYPKTGEIIALFPTTPADNNKNNCLSYMYIGQHGAASYHGVIKDTVPASDFEKQAMLNHLSGQGYDNLQLKKVGHYRYTWYRRLKMIPASIRNHAENLWMSGCSKAYMSAFLYGKYKNTVSLSDIDLLLDHGLDQKSEK